MKYPANVIELVHEIVAANPDIQAAKESALNQVRKLPNFKEFVDDLVSAAITEMVYDARHSATKQTKRAERSYGGGAKVKHHTSGVETAYRTFCDNFFIGGKTLASITGDEIPDLVAGEIGRANGYRMNAALLQWVQGRGIKPGETVAEWMKRTKTSDQAMRQRFVTIEKEVLKTTA